MENIHFIFSSSGHVCILWAYSCHQMVLNVQIGGVIVGVKSILSPKMGMQRTLGESNLNIVFRGFLEYVMTFDRSKQG